MTDFLMEPSDLDEFLRNHYRVVAHDPRRLTWSLEFAGETDTFTLQLTWEKTRLRLTLPLPGTAPRGPSCLPRLFEYLLSANSELEWGFFALEPDGTPALKSRLITEHLAGTTLKTVVDYLVTEADDRYFNILNLAYEPRAEVVEDDED